MTIIRTACSDLSALASLALFLGMLACWAAVICGA